MVSDLIDPVKRGWNADLVARTFLSHEAASVLSIPISPRLPDDSVIWGCTTNGRFSVRSAYGVALKWLKEDSRRPEFGSCSDNSKMKAIWKVVWCDTKIKLPVVPPSSREFVDVVWEILEARPSIDWVAFAVTAWSLWNNRNTMTFGGQCKGQGALIKAAREYAEEIKSVRPSRLGSPHPPLPNCPWLPPHNGWYKINTDGAVFSELGSCGIGVVIRNERGLLMGSMSKMIDVPLGALEVEARAVEEGVRLAWDLGLKKIVLESDSLSVVNAVRVPSLSPSSILKVVEGTRLELCCFDEWDISHTRRSGNSAAHVMAKYAKSVSDCIIWVEDTPPLIAALVQHDMYLLNFSSI
nr:uncharacterized protein LOC111992470 [Quercus suber]